MILILTSSPFSWWSSSYHRPSWHPSWRSLFSWSSWQALRQHHQQPWELSSWWLLTWWPSWLILMPFLKLYPLLYWYVKILFGKDMRSMTDPISLYPKNSSWTARSDCRTAALSRIEKEDRKVEVYMLIGWRHMIDVVSYYSKITAMYLPIVFFVCYFLKNRL